MMRTKIYRIQVENMKFQSRQLEIANAAWRVVSREGFAAATMRKIAKEMHCTTGVLSHYFDSRQELLNFTLERILAIVFEQAKTEPKIFISYDAYRRYLISLVPRTKAQLEFWRAWIGFMGAALQDRELRKLHEQAYQRISQSIQTILRSLADNQQIILSGESDLIADQIVCYIDGLGLRATLSKKAWSIGKIESLVNQFLDNLLSGSKTHS